MSRICLLVARYKATDSARISSTASGKDDKVRVESPNDHVDNDEEKRDALEDETGPILLPYDSPGRYQLVMGLPVSGLSLFSSKLREPSARSWKSLPLPCPRSSCDATWTSNALSSHARYSLASSGAMKVSSSPAALAERMLLSETFLKPSFSRTS